MDRADRLISNRAPMRILGVTICLILAAVIGAWVLSGILADRVIAREIAAMLSISGGGAFTDAPAPDTIAVGEALWADYGIHADMMPALMADYDGVRLLFFWCMTIAAVLVCLIGCGAALFEVNRIYIQLEALRTDCLALAEQTQELAELRGEVFGSVHRVCEGVNQVAGRMRYLSGRLLKEKNFMKDFLTDFSHQIKNTLAGIRLSSDMLTELERLSPEQRETLATELDGQLAEIEQLVAASLKLAKLNADAVLYEKADYPLEKTCEMAVSRLNPLLRTRNISVELRTDDALLFHDPVWLGEAVQNLLQNAADHAECSTVSLEVEQIPGAVKLCIADNGRGIPQMEIPKLFERFGKKSTGNGVQSVGVGLAIAKQIVEAHNGAITVYSEPGKGTRFELLFLTPAQ